MFLSLLKVWTHEPRTKTVKGLSYSKTPKVRKGRESDTGRGL